MIRVLIADDEWKVCKVIEKLIDWEELGIELAGVASNGIEEYEMIESLRPDIVITDIRMPGIDGLEVIEKVRQQEIQTDFIVVSGYKYFDYAYNALKYGVEDYLLKPIQKEELNKILKKIVFARKEKEQIYQKQQHLESQRESSQKILLKNFFDRICRNRDFVFDGENVKKEFGLEFEKPAFIPYAVIVNAANNEKPEDDALGYFANVLYKKMKTYLGGIHEGCQNFVSIDQVYLLGILNYEEDSCDAVSVLEECFEDLLEFAQSFHGYDLTLSIGESFERVEELPMQVRKTIQNLRARLVMGVNRILYWDHLNQGVLLEADQILSDRDYQELKRTVASGEMEAIEFALKEAFRKINQHDNLNFNQYYDTVFEIVHVAFLALENEKETIPEEEKICKGVLQIYQKNLIRNFVIHYLTDSLQKYFQTKKIQETKPIRIVKDYLKQHYAESIGLEDAAALVDLNSVYLSVLFKRSTGVNFNDYLTEIRMSEAKKFLVQTNLTINEIAEKVGYGNSKYFSQLFTKIVGLKPTVYRKLHS